MLHGISLNRLLTTADRC